MPGYDDLDEEIKKIIAKADRIVKVEELQKKRIERLTAFREEDGRIKLRIQQKKKELQEKQENLETAREIWEEHETYLKLLELYTGEELQEKLHEQIDGYNWPVYSKIQDRLYRVTSDKSEEEMMKEISEMKADITELEEIRSSLVDEALDIIQEIHRRIERIK